MTHRMSGNSRPGSRKPELQLLQNGRLTEADKSLLQARPAFWLSAILKKADPLLLAAALREQVFPEKLLLQTVREQPSLDPRLRILLMHPALSSVLADKKSPYAENEVQHTDTMQPTECPAAPHASMRTDAPDAEKHAAPAPEKDPREALSRAVFHAGTLLPFLRVQLEEMKLIPDSSILYIGTDGFSFYFRPECRKEITSPDFLHMLIHCMFMHMNMPEKYQRDIWDLSCDLAAEYLRCELFPYEGAHLRQVEIMDVPGIGNDPRNPRRIYTALMDLYEDELESLKHSFSVDDHRYWYAAPAGSSRKSPDGARDLSKCWAWVQDSLSLPGRQENRYGLHKGSREEKMLIREEGKYDFTRYLRRFSVMREEVQLDPGSFDYIPYYYGLQRYGNLPLLEPLEYMESFRIQELVIAIDTSGSCSAPVVERFLSEIRRVLMQKENFFRKMNVHIIQCDYVIQDHAAIHSPEEWNAYLKHLKIKGRGGTSFVPVFTLVEELIRKGVLKDLRGLLYFTDGDGIYPRQKPEFETAFVFKDHKALSFPIPDWIIPLCLE